MRLTSLQKSGYFDGLPQPLWEFLFAGLRTEQLPRGIRFTPVSEDFPIAEAGAGYHSRLTGRTTVFAPPPTNQQLHDSLCERGTLPPEFFTLTHELTHATQKIPAERTWRLAGYLSLPVLGASALALGPAYLLPAAAVWGYVLHKGGHFARWMGDTSLAREMHAVQASLCTPWSWGTQEYRDQYIDAVLQNLGGRHTKTEALKIFDMIDGLKLMGVSDQEIGSCLGPVRTGRGSFRQLTKLSLRAREGLGLDTHEQYEEWLSRSQKARDERNEGLRTEARRLFAPPRA